MNIKWYGQSSFLLTTEKGTRILIDPYDRFLGYRMPVVDADIVAITHDHGDHNKLEAAAGHYILANQPLRYEKDDVVVTGVRTFHDKVGGAKRGNNCVFVFRADGLSVCHCGDLGHLLTDEQIREIGPVDVLLVPVGGRLTLNGAEAAEVMRQLGATVALPMHYRTKATGIIGKLLFAKSDDFIAAVGGRHTVGLKDLNIDRNRLESYHGVVTLDYEQRQAKADERVAKRA